MLRVFKFRSSKVKLTYLLMVPLTGLLIAAGWGLQALAEAQTRNLAALQTERTIHAGIRMAQAAEAVLTRPDTDRDSAAIPEQLRQLSVVMAKLGLPASGVGQASDSHAALAASMRQTANSLEQFAQQEARRLEAVSQEQFDRVAGGLAAVIALATVIGIFLRVTIRRNIVESTRAGAEAAQRVAAGDLTVEVEVPSNGQSKATLAAMKIMIADLRTLVGGVAASARTVAQASAQIAQGNLDLSQRTEEQASTLEETASSMEELSSTVTQTAENARQASQLAQGASQVARKGGEAVGQVVATMTGISESSRRIGDIIGVIDGIAFQTNILALNAAVEAARAGDQGRGFAVVASEVRSLAQRSAAAAKEIKSLIGESMDKVEAGTRLVDAAGKTMEEIVASVKKVSDLVTEIAAATQEQSSGIGQVNTAVTQMEQVMQQNASLAEEATAATESLRGQADTLLQLVSRFNIGEQQVRTAVASPRSSSLQPIQFRPRAHPASTYAALGSYAPKAKPNGHWEEF
jgi:methyl-accepting chemotaxis protein